VRGNPFVEQAFGNSGGFGANGGHNGVDLISSLDPGSTFEPTSDGVVGREVFAIEDGVIIGIYGPPDYLDYSPSGVPGVTIEIEHGSERWQYTHVYVNPQLKIGSKVNSETQIGYYAQIGYSYSSHLHVTRKTNIHGNWVITDPGSFDPRD
jgi:murein DD-endopeptidase MepM/ murein hydrolase activator NlpD